jgi:hypothetical protein
MAILHLQESGELQIGPRTPFQEEVFRQITKKARDMDLNGDPITLDEAKHNAAKKLGYSSKSAKHSASMGFVPSRKERPILADGFKDVDDLPEFKLSIWELISQAMMQKELNPRRYC